MDLVFTEQVDDEESELERLTILIGMVGDQQTKGTVEDNIRDLAEVLERKLESSPRSYIPVLLAWYDFE